MLYHNNGITILCKSPQYVNEFVHICKMKSCCRLIK